MNQILSYVNVSVRACDDYYKYACGKWGEVHENDDFKEITGLIDHKVNSNLVNIMSKLQQKYQNGSSPPNSVEAKVLSFYQTCRQAELSTRSSKHYLELVPPNDQIAWPQFKRQSDVWGSSKFHWMETLARLQRYGLKNVLFQLNVRPDLYNSSKYSIYVDMPYFEHKSNRLAKFLLWVTLRMLGVHKSRAWSLAEQVQQLEFAVRELAEIDYELQPTLYEELSLRQLELRSGGQWRKYLQILLGRRIPAHLILHVENVEYLLKLSQMVGNFDREVLASYIMLRFVAHLQAETMDSNLPIECVQDVRRNMELATNLIYEQRLIGFEKVRQLETDVLELFELLRKQFLKKLDVNHLRLQPAQLALLRAKMRSMAINIGNMPMNANHSNFVTRFYADLQLLEDRDYALNHLRLLEFRTRRWLEQLNSPLRASTYFFMSDSDTGMSSAPYYMVRHNTIVVPFGMLQEPVFDHDAHDIFKISFLGFILGHELIHGFESTGLVMDAHGNFDERGEQITYTRRYMAGMRCLNQNKTDYLSEREADIAGIRLAYDVYFDRDSKFSQSQPSFTNRTLKELFFLNVAQFFCGNAAPTDFADHDPDEIRLRQLLINFSAFAETHNCRQGLDNMHPARKCRLW